MALIQATPLGEWIFKSKSKQNSCGLQGACKGFMFGLQVTELLEIWPEQVTHGRRWVSMSFYSSNWSAQTWFYISSSSCSCSMLCSGTSRWGVWSVPVRLDAGSTWQTERAAAVREKFQAFAIAGAGGLIELVHGDAGCRWRYCSTVLRLLIISLPMAVTSSFPRHLKFQEPDGSRCICWGLNRACRKSRNVRTLWNHQNDITSLINNHFMLLRTNWKKLTNFKFYLLNVSPYEWNNFDNCNMLLNIWMKPPRIIWCPENRTEWCRKLIIWPLDVQVKNSK